MDLLKLCLNLFATVTFTKQEGAMLGRLRQLVSAAALTLYLEDENVQSASDPLSPVRMRTISSKSVTKIFPSPIWPVRAVRIIVSMTSLA